MPCNDGGPSYEQIQEHNRQVMGLVEKEIKELNKKEK